jgi:hypothetical protein
MLSKTLKTIVVGAAAALTVGGASLSADAAGAAPWHDGHGWHGGGYGHDGGWRDRGGGWHGRDDFGAALGVGILGVVIGESLNHPYYGAPPGAYVGPGYWGYYGNCRGYWRWQPRWHRYVRDERCY